MSDGPKHMQPVWDICEACEGTGERDWLSGAPCVECNGKGLVDINYRLDDEDWLS